MLDIDIEQINSPSVRTFQPDLNDKSGRTALRVADAPAGATYRWATQPDAVQFIAPNAPATSMLAGRPGVRTVSVEVIDAKTGDSGTATTWIGIPQFVVVHEYTGSYPTHRKAGAFSAWFDTVLREYRLAGERDFILQQAQAVADLLLRRANVRVVWDLAPLNEQLPAQFQAGNFAEHFYTPLRLAGFPPITRQNSAGVVEQIQIEQIGITDRPGGVRPAQGVIEIYPGAIDSGTSVVARTAAIVRDAAFRAEDALAADPGNSDLQQEFDRLHDLWREIVARMIGVAMAHEIHHLLLSEAPGLTGGHTALPEIDLLSPGSELSIKEWTGIGVPDPFSGSFPNAGTYIDAGFDGLAVIDDRNQAMVEVMFAVPPAHPFD
jgi:hypothetical protein